MVSWSATAMDDLLVAGYQRETPRAAVANYLRQKWGLKFINLAATDDQLCGELVNELKLRAIDLTDPANHVVLLCEWDTFYGRTLPVSFAAEVECQRRTIGGGLPKSQWLRDSLHDIMVTPHDKSPYAIDGVLPNVHARTYLRGIDGILVKDQENSADRAPKPPGSTTSHEQDAKAKQEMNRAEGQNQLDYIPRVAMELQEMDHALRAGTLDMTGRKGEIRAIGVVGSDFYDKLLILQALRPYFPEAVFFTTDLDARYLDPQFNRWTRNLVIASGFGLSLEPTIQREIPPFRGSYQTAAFFATRVALGSIQPDQYNARPSPRRFEIGRLRPFDLSVAEDPGKIHPDPKRHGPTPKCVLAVVLTLVAAFILLRAVVPCFRHTLNAVEQCLRRQQALRFTEEDILRPACIAKRIQRGALPGIVPPFPTRHTIRSLTHWLNHLLDRSSWNPHLGPLATKHLPSLVGEKISRSLLTQFFRPQLWAAARQTELMARRRLAIESYFPTCGPMRKIVPPGVRAPSVEIGSCWERCYALNSLLRGASRGGWSVAAAAIPITAVVILENISPQGEPFSLTEGVSIWPCEIVRFCAFLLLVLFILKARVNLRISEAGLSETFYLTRYHRRPLWQRWSTLARLSAKGYSGYLSLLRWPRTLIRIYRHYSAIDWSWIAKENIPVERLWHAYLDRSRTLPRILRVSKHLTIYLAFCGLVVYLGGVVPRPPARGYLPYYADLFLLGVTVLTFLFLNFLVTDAARLTRTFIRHLSKAPTKWPIASMRLAREHHGAMTIRAWTTGLISASSPN